MSGCSTGSGGRSGVRAWGRGGTPTLGGGGGGGWWPGDWNIERMAPS